MDDQRRREIEEEERLRAELRSRYSAPSTRTAPPVDGRVMAMLGLIAGGGVLAVIGSFTAWISATVAFAGSISKSGIDGGDGWITLALGVGLLGCALWLYQSRTKVPGIVASIGSLALLAITVYEWNDVADRVDKANAKLAELGGVRLGTASVGTGIWLLWAGSILALIGSVWAARAYWSANTKATPAQPQAPSALGDPAGVEPPSPQ